MNPSTLQGVKAGIEAAAKVAADVVAERQRQIAAEGWTPEHDDQHTDGSLAQAAACYALQAAARSQVAATARWLSFAINDLWPWATRWWKPTNSRRDLVKAGALILAEIERLDRALNPSSIAASVPADPTSAAVGRLVEAARTLNRHAKEAGWCEGARAKCIDRMDVALSDPALAPFLPKEKK